MTDSLRTEKNRLLFARVFAEQTLIGWLLLLERL